MANIAAFSGELNVIIGKRPRGTPVNQNLPEFYLITARISLMVNRCTVE